MDSAPRGIVFVVGASRSGTTLMSRILGRHPRLLATNELHYFGDLCDPFDLEQPLPEAQAVAVAATLYARFRRGLWQDMPDERDYGDARALVAGLCSALDGRVLFEAFLRQLALDQVANIIVEQTPRNIYYAQRLLEAYPEARIVHMVRDPRAVLASQKKRWTRRWRLKARNIPWHEALREWVAYHPVTMCLLWRKAYAEGEALTGHPRYLRLRFEDLLDRPVAGVEAVCAFLGVGFHATMLEEEQVDSSLRAADEGARGVQARAAGEWKAVLDPGEVFLTEKLLDRPMVELGYRPEGQSVYSAMFSLAWHGVRFPFHVVATLLVDPRRFLIQLKGVLRGAF
jgi:hypothetical protein